MTALLSLRCTPSSAFRTVSARSVSVELKRRTRRATAVET